MALKSYIVIKDFKTPYVTQSARGDRPTDIRMKRFRRGEIINGELKHANNQPAFVLVKGMLVVPLNVIKEVVTKEVSSGFDGGLQDSKKSEAAKVVTKTVNKMKYIDAIIVGGLLGGAVAYLAEKKGWLGPVDKKNKLYGAAIGAFAGLYIAYRFKTPVKKKD